MPKMKTHSGTKKRFSMTGTGKVAYRKNGRGHLLTSKSTRRRRQLRMTGYVSHSLEGAMKKLLPYA
jgi:large subunit ribosomal protein L35